MADRGIAKTDAGKLVRTAKAVLPFHKTGKASGADGVAAKGNAACRKAQAGIGREMGRLQSQTVGMGRIIGVHAGNERPPRQRKTGIEGRGKAAGRKMQATQGNVFLRGLDAQALEQQGGLVCGAIVHHDDFKIGQGAARRRRLLQQAAQGRRQGGGSVAGGQQYRDCRLFFPAGCHVLFSASGGMPSRRRAHAQTSPRGRAASRRWCAACAYRGALSASMRLRESRAGFAERAGR